MIDKRTSPIMISGMHRSGTSMLTGVLNDLGLIIGNILDSNKESIFFQRINIWMMSLLGASWDSPKQFEDINDDLRDNVVEQIKQLLSSRTNSLYFGWSSIIKKKSFNELSNPWGWKDPRNTFTGTIWNEVFPNLKAIYIIRHPIDVAESLMRRQKVEIGKDLDREKKYSDIVKALMSVHHTNYNSSMLIKSYSDCFSLIDTYYSQILANKVDNSIIFKFEVIISKPEVVLERILNFSEISYKTKALNLVSDNMKKDRSYAYRKDRRLVEFESLNEDLIIKMGY